jgi:hypothetical protein
MPFIEPHSARAQLSCQSQLIANVSGMSPSPEKNPVEAQLASLAVTDRRIYSHTILTRGHNPGLPGQGRLAL